MKLTEFFKTQYRKWKTRKSRRRMERFDRILQEHCDVYYRNNGQERKEHGK